MSVEQVVQAVRSLNVPGLEASVRREAIKWLEHFQNTLEAWNVSLAILNTPPTTTANANANPTTTMGDEAVRFFAAQTLKHKLVVDWLQLDEDMIGQLKDRLLAMVMAVPGIAKGRTVRQQLVLALAALAVQCPTRLWNSPVEDLLRAICGESTTGEVTSIRKTLVDVLAGIPEQLDNRMLAGLTSEERREREQRLVEANVDQVVETMGELLRHNIEGEAALKCLNSWIRYGKSTRLVSSVALLQTILGRLQWYLQQDEEIIDEEAVEMCSDILCEMFYLLFQQQEEADKSKESIPMVGEEYLRLLFGGLHSMLQLLQKFTRNPIDNNETTISINEHESQIIIAVERVYVEAGEAFLSHIWGNGPALQVIIEATLLLADRSRDRRVVEVTFNWWTALEMRISSSKTGSEEEQEQLLAPFRPVFATLFRTLIARHLTYPTNITWSSEERDAFRDFRHTVGDCLKDCTRVLGSTETLLLISDLLKNSHQDVNSCWQKTEAALFALRTISSAVDGRESEALPGIFTTLLNGPQPHPKIVYAIILNIGCYAEWARYHPEFVGPFLAYLLHHFGYGTTSNGEDLRPAIVLALRYLAESCATHLVAHEAVLRPLYLQCVATTTNQDTKPQATTTLRPRDGLEVTEAVANVLAAAGPTRRQHWLPIYSAPWLSLLSSQSTLLPNISMAMENLATFINVLSIEDEGDDSIEKLIAQLSELLLQRQHLIQLSAKDPAIADALILLLKAVLVTRPLGPHTAPLLDLLDVLYSQFGIEGVLYVFRMAILAAADTGHPIPSDRILHSLRTVLSSSSSSKFLSGSATDLYSMLTTILDTYGISPFTSIFLDGSLDQLLGLTLLPPSPHVDPAEVGAALHLLIRLLTHLTEPSSFSNSAGELPQKGELTSHVFITSRSIILGALELYPLPLISDVAALFRRLYALHPDEWRRLLDEQLSLVLSSNPTTTADNAKVLFLPRERQVWLERLEGAIRKGRPRDLKDALLALVDAYRRRRPHQHKSF